MGLKFNYDGTPASFLNRLDNNHGPIVTGSASYTGTPDFHGITFSFNASASGAIEDFSIATTTDQDGIIGQPVKDDSKKVVLPPQILFTNDKAWLKYRVEADVSVGANVPLPDVAIGIKGTRTAVFTDIHVHDPGEITGEAIIADLPKLRFAADAADLSKLKENEAFSYHVNGTLSANVTLTLSDIFSANLSGLTSLLQSSKLIAIQFSYGLTAKLNVTLTDDFVVVFSGAAGGKIRLAVKKTKSSNVDASANLGITASFTDPTVIQTVLNQFVQSAAGQSITAIDNILAKASLSNLTPEEMAIVNSLAHLFGWPEDILKSIGAVKKEWETLKAKLTDTINAIANAKVSAGFAYEYTRISTNDTLLEAELDLATAEDCHPYLLFGDLNHTLKYLSGHPNQLIKYLNQKTLTRTHAWGFTLGVGPWTLLSGQDKKTLARTTQTDDTDPTKDPNKKPGKRIAYDGVRSYNSNFFGIKDEWIVDFNAQMAGFSTAPNVKDFTYGLSLHFDWTTKLSENSLRSLLDHAVIWRILSVGGPLNDVQNVIDRTRENFNKSALVSVDLKIDDTTLRQLLPTTDSPDNDAGSFALAMAMPYWPGFQSTMFPASRVLCYQELWKDYLRNPQGSVGGYAAEASDYIFKLYDQDRKAHQQDPSRPALLPDGNGLAAQEKANNSNYTFAGQIRLDGQTSDNDYSGVSRNWQSFWKGFRELNNALTSNPPADSSIIEKVFNDLQRFWSQSLFVRAAGVYLLQAAGTKGLLDKVERTVTIAPQGLPTTVYGKSN